MNYFLTKKASINPVKPINADVNPPESFMI